MPGNATHRIGLTQYMLPGVRYNRRYSNRVSVPTAAQFMAEVAAQQRAARAGLSPAILHHDASSRTFWSELVRGRTLHSVARKGNGTLSEHHQRSIVALLGRLGSVDVFHGDCHNPHNYVLDEETDEFKLVDFEVAGRISSLAWPWAAEGRLGDLQGINLLCICPLLVGSYNSLYHSGTRPGPVSVVPKLLVRSFRSYAATLGITKTHIPYIPARVTAHAAGNKSPLSLFSDHVRPLAPCLQKMPPPPPPPPYSAWDAILDARSVGSRA